MKSAQLLNRLYCIYFELQLYLSTLKRKKMAFLVFLMYFFYFVFCAFKPLDYYHIIIVLLYVQLKHPGQMMAVFRNSCFVRIPAS